MTDDARGTVTVIDLAHRRVISTVDVGAGAHHMSFDIVHRRAWVALGESARTIVVLSTEDLAHAAIDWLAGLTDATGSRRHRLLTAFAAIDLHLASLLEHALAGLAVIPGVRTLGRARRRTSTISFVIDGHHPSQIATRLADQGIAVWAGDNYAYELMRRFGLSDSGGAIRASLVLYNTREDVDRLLGAVADIARR